MYMYLKSQLDSFGQQVLWDYGSLVGGQIILSNKYTAIYIAKVEYEEHL